jgi:hypothetical protein
MENNSKEYWENKYHYIKQHYDINEMQLDEMISCISDLDKRHAHATRIAFRKKLVDKALMSDNFTTPFSHE